MDIKKFKNSIKYRVLNTKSNARIFFFFSLLLIGFVFILVGFETYRQFSSDVIHNEFENQQQMTKIIDQLLSRYFYTLKFITQNTVMQPEFNPRETINDAQILYQKIPTDYARKKIVEEKISNILIDKRHSVDVSTFSMNNISKSNIENWRVFKALPDKDQNGNYLAKIRRERAKTILETYPDIHYVFQMLANGDLIFLEPYNTQKNVTIFNYAFRDYLNLAKSNRETSISEGYISNDQYRTQIITVANPIMDEKNNVVGVFAASISSSTLRDTVFKTLKNNMNINNGTIFYLIDRHGHIVASSSGKNIYFPEPNNKNDNNDPGNMRNIGFFQTINWTKDSFEKGNLWEREIASWNDKNLKNIYTGRYVNLDRVNVVATFYPTTLGGHSINWGVLIETPVSQVLASASHLRHVFYIAGFSLSVILVFLFIITLRNFKRLEDEVLTKEKEIIRVTTQVAHDIRSPLVALDMLLDNLGNVKEDIRITVKTAVNRINDIANNLLQQYKKAGFNTTKHSPTAPEIIALMVDSVISEKIIEYRNDEVSFLKEFNDDTYGIFSSVNSSEFKRAISNLINNAVQATYGGKGLIIVKLYKKMDTLILSIIDNGCGISKNLIPKILNGHIDRSKAGTGLGLPYAVSRFESWGCSLELKSEVDKGTIVEITLPQTKSAEWFKPALKIKQESIIVVVDDDESIHGVWEQRFKNIFHPEDNIIIEHFIDAASFFHWYESTNIDKINVTYLMDYELRNDELNGIDIIKKLGIAENSVLVSSRFEDDNVRAECHILKLKAIPKNYVRYIAIDVICINPDLIFIDDIESVTQTWKIKAQEVGIKIATFNKINEFLQLIDIYDKNVKIYIDSDLNDDLRGEVFAKELYQKGFKYIYLATGFERHSFDNMPWITAIVTKTPPY